MNHSGNIRDLDVAVQPDGLQPLERLHRTPSNKLSKILDGLRKRRFSGQTLCTKG